MANRVFDNNGLTLEKRPVTLFAKATIGASGAPTLVAASSKGIASITRDGSVAGKYTITLSDVYAKLFSARCTFKTINATTAPAAPHVTLTSEAVASSKTIILQCWGATNSSTTTLIATDPGNGEEMYLRISLGDSSL